MSQLSSQPQDIDIFKKRKTKTVSFNNYPIIIHEPYNLAKDLRDARRSDLNQRHADKYRMEKLLTPVFEVNFRKKMYTKLVLQKE